MHIALGLGLDIISFTLNVASCIESKGKAEAWSRCLCSTLCFLVWQEAHAPHWDPRWTMLVHLAASNV
jgi:hypothetical protein